MAHPQYQNRLSGILNCVFSFLAMLLVSQCSDGASDDEAFDRALRSLYVVCYMQSQLGFFIKHKKSHLHPSSSMIHLGLGICSKTLSFWIPEKKKVSFAEVRENILLANQVALKQLQRFVGKCQSFLLVFPAASLFIRECCAFMSKLDDALPTPLSQDVRAEILFWRFIDSFSQPIPWKKEHHVSVTLSSDASGFRWGGVLAGPSGNTSFGDYWPQEILAVEDICWKEALALYFVLLSVVDSLWDRRVDVTVDALSLFDVWSRRRAKSTALARVLKLIFALTLEANFTLQLRWVPSSQNPADAPSREISKADARLPQPIWKLLQRQLGGPRGFTFDLMALPSNVPNGLDGSALKFYSREPTPGSAGVNVFAQQCPVGEELYVFPPFVLIASLIRLFQEWGNVKVTIVVPKHPHPRPWWPLLVSFARQSVRLSEAGQTGVIEYPSVKGYTPNKTGLPFQLWALECFFPGCGKQKKENPPSKRKNIFLLSDFMFRGLKGFSWPLGLNVQLITNGGHRILSLCRAAAATCRRHSQDAVVLHGGINDFSRLTDCQEGVQEVIRVFRAAAVRLQAEFPECVFILSSVCQTRLVKVNRSVAAVNEALRAICSTANWVFLSNDYIMQEDLIDDVHLSLWGSLKLHRRLQMVLRSALTLRSGPDIACLQRPSRTWVKTNFASSFSSVTGYWRG